MRNVVKAAAAFVLIGSLPGCSSSLGSTSGDDACPPGAACQMPPPFQPPQQPAPGPSATSNGDMAPPTLSNPQPTPVQPAAPTGPVFEPPLTDAERAQLGSIEGLVSAQPRNGLKATVVNEDKVLRAFLKWKQDFYRTCDDGSSYILKTDITQGDAVVSEGIGYGMLIAVAVGDRPMFDGLWKHYEDRRNDNGVMHWRYAPCGGRTGDNGASDADLDAAMGLVLGESRWGGYAEDARALIDTIGTNETQICGGSQTVLKPGDSWGGCDIVNPSYFSPGYYRRFAQFQPERADFWNDFTADTYALLDNYQGQRDGLIPDWARPDGSLFNDGREVFGYEAVRGPWRVAVDYVWSGNEDARAFLQGMAAHVDTKGGLAQLADADDFEDKRNSAFLGTLSLPGIVTTQAAFDQYVADWEAYEKDDVWYYQATLRLLSLLLAGGYFPVEY
ncbi:MAG: glycosyl hydrolase family 8 [Polyangiaceae bacterium]